MTSTNDKLEDVKRRVKYLLALSKSPNENEAVAALEKARALMEEYHLTEGECKYVHNGVKATKRKSGWRSILANTVAPLYYCAHYRRPESGEMVFYGDQFDAFLAGEMFGYLEKTVLRMTKNNVRRNAKAKYREQYRFGVAFGIFDKVEQMGKAASWGPERDTKLLAVNEALTREVALEIDKGKPHKVGGNAFVRGMEAGHGVSLARQATGSGGRYLGASR